MQLPKDRQSIQAQHRHSGPPPIDGGPVSAEESRLSAANRRGEKAVGSTLSIAMVTDDFLPAKTGVGVHVQKITPELVKMGHSIVVLTTRRPGQATYELWKGVHVYRFFSVPLAGFYQAVPAEKTLIDIFRTHQVQAVHLHYLSYLVFKAMQAGKSLGLPIVYTAHMTIDYLTQPVFMKPFYRPLAWAFRWLMKRIDRVICVSRNQLDEFKPYKAQTSFISNPIDFKGIEAEDSTRANQFKVLYVGRLEPKKNLPYLISAFQLLNAQRPNVELVIAGTGTEEQDLHQRVDKAGLSEKVVFLGQVPHDKLPELYASCDVFVLPSVLDTQGMVVLEAMRFRRPVIVTNKIISARELVEPGTNGFIVDADNVDDLAEKLLRLCDNPDLRRQMGEASYNHFPIVSSDEVAQKLEAVYLG